MILGFTGCAGGHKHTHPHQPTSAPEGEQCLAEAQAPSEFPDTAPSKIEVSHLLITHRDAKSRITVERNRQEACLRAQQALATLESSGDWSGTFEQYADNAGSLEGSLGRIERDQALPAFANVAFSLEVNQLSYVVETERAFHIILRTR